jgi:phosphoribosyl-ATP pyrophosphohydrolase/phosphoribosyl-AMP cyclohydrolase
VLARVLPAGPACHTGTVSCFGDEGLGADALGVLDRTIAERFRALESPSMRGAPPEPQDSAALGSDHHHSIAPATHLSRPPSYTQRLLADRNLRLKKLGEEIAEVVIACADADSGRAAEEGADVVYHLLVALRAVGASLDDVRQVLADRARAASPNDRMA